MKKDIRSILYGFTMAEILISLAIAMIVATAMVPVFGTKKVKRPTNKIEHGIVACYYNGSNQLQYEVRKNVEDGAARDGSPGGTECTFMIPSKASHVKIIAIGAGGNGGGNTFQMQVVNGANSGNGSIRIDNNFQDDIEASSSKDSTIPNKIRSTFNEWASRRQGEVYALYSEVRSPIGAGGSGKCKAVYCNASCAASDPYKNGDAPNGSWYSQRTNCPQNNYTSGCWHYQHGKGGNSGKGLMVKNISLPINGDSTIKIDETDQLSGVSVTTGGTTNSISMTASGAGGNPTYNDAAGRYADGSDSNVASTCTYKGSKNWCAQASSQEPGNQGKKIGIEIPALQKCEDNEARAIFGIVKYRGKGLGREWSANSAYTWEYNDPAVIPTLSTKGDYGSEVVQVFNNLKGSLTLHPARGIGDTSRVLKENQIIVSTTTSSQNGRTLATGTPYPVNEQIPKEIAELGKPENKEHFTYLDAVNGTGFRIPLSNCGQNCPGYAGTGTYLFVKDTNAINSVKLVNNQSGATYTKFFSKYENFDNLSTCPNGDSLVSYPGVAWAGYCRGSKSSGNWGGIIVIW